MEFYEVSKGDTLLSISEKEGIAVSSLKSINNIRNESLELGQIIHLKAAHSIRRVAWRRRLDAEVPSDRIHTSSIPPVLEALSLLPLAYRVGSYLAEEKKKGRGAVFDFNGITLAPPNPGPYGGWS